MTVGVKSFTKKNY